MCADVLHAGHILGLQEAKNNCDYLIVGLNCAPDGKHPIQSIFERYIQLQAVKYVDKIIPYGGEKDLVLLAKSISYDIRFLGEDYINKHWDAKEIEEERGIRPYFISRKHNLSSTELKGRISKTN